MSFSCYCKPVTATVTATVTVTVDTMEAFDMEAIAVEDNDSIDSLLAEFELGEDDTLAVPGCPIPKKAHRHVQTWAEFNADEMARLSKVATAELLEWYGEAMETYYYHLNSTGFKMKSEMALAERIEQTIDGRVKNGEVVDGWTTADEMSGTIKVS